MRPIEPRLGGFYRLYYLKQQQEQPSKPSEPPPPPLPRHEPAEFQDYAEYMQRHELPPPEEAYAIKGFEKWTSWLSSLPSKAAEAAQKAWLPKPVIPEDPAEMMVTPEKLERTALATGFVASLGVAPATALTGAALSAGVSTAVDVSLHGEVPSPEDLARSMAVGAMASAATAKVMEKLVVPKASEWLTKRYTEYEKAVVEAIRKGDSVKLGEWRGWSEKLVMKLTGAKPHLARGVVDIPTPEIVSLKGLEAMDVGFELSIAPKMTGEMISKMPSDVLAKTWVKEHVYAWTTGGLSYTLVEKELKTLRTVKPYIPEIGLEKAGKVSPIIPGISSMLAGIGPKLVKPKPSEVSPKLAPEVSPKTFSLPKTFRLPKIFQFPDITEKAETREKTVPTIKAEPSTIQEVKQVQRAAAIAVSKITLPKTFISRPAFKETFTFPKMFPRGRRGRKGLGLTGWYRWDYPTLSPEKLLKSFGLTGFARRRRRR